MALALDATSLGDRFVVLAISVVYRGCAVPVAWSVLPAGEQRAWRPEWQRTHMIHPDRAARLWLVSVGAAADADDTATPRADLTRSFPRTRRTRRATRLRLVGVFRRGWMLILVALLHQVSLPLASFFPEPWPALHDPEPAHDAPALALRRTAA